MVVAIPTVNSIRVIIILSGSYSAHSRPPFIHSKTNPSVKITIKVIEIGIKVEGGVISLAAGKGKSSAISRSNSKNKMATRKNRNEKGNRADFSGSKPHS